MVRLFLGVCQSSFFPTTKRRLTKKGHNLNANIRSLNNSKKLTVNNGQDLCLGIKLQKVKEIKVFVILTKSGQKIQPRLKRSKSIISSRIRINPEYFQIPGQVKHWFPARRFTLRDSIQDKPLY